MIRSKRCFKCNTLKPLEEFYKHPKMADGHLNKCKQCAKHDSNTRREEKLDEIREYDRQRSKNKDRMRASYEVTKIWREADRRRVAAHNAVARAIKSGVLVRQPCQECGEPKSVAHHEDYDRKLDVMWLCQPCHVQRHQRLKSV